MACKKCKSVLVYENDEYEVSYCESCDVIEISSKSLWHKVSLKVSEIKCLKTLNYSMNFILFDRMTKLYNVVTDNNFIEVVNFLEEYLFNEKEY